MSDIKTVLTDERVDQICKDVYGYVARDPEMRRRCARAIERAVLAAATPVSNMNAEYARGRTDGWDAAHGAMSAQLEAVRNAALEEAAIECEKVDTDYHQHPTDKFACWTNRGSGCAGAIRHLKSASVSEQKGEQDNG